ncbi:hypothetical protein Scep_007207 [Stephania cephalantha]|uniref:Uncharacterized protein n=1 Tax=Stephania cephalantha TaxID=152367 RepID=A0AAP0PNL7_9MAGN
MSMLFFPHQSSSLSILSPLRLQHTALTLSRCSISPTPFSVKPLPPISRLSTPDPCNSRLSQELFVYELLCSLLSRLSNSHSLCLLIVEVVGDWCGALWVRGVMDG